MGAEKNGSVEHRLILDSINKIMGRSAAMPKTTDQRLEHIESEIAGLKADVSGLKADVSGLKDDVSGLKADVSGLKADVGDLKGEMKEVRATLAQVLQLLARIDGRLDEQRATLNALIPTRLAAVPSAA